MRTSLTKRTFENYRKDIEETFDVDIICDASHGYQYRVERNEDLINDRIKVWLLNI